MALVFLLLVILALVFWGFFTLLDREDQAREDDPPEVAAMKPNLYEYARLQHTRAERYERLLREVWAEDGVGMPTLSADLRQRIEKTLDR